MQPLISHSRPAIEADDLDAVTRQLESGQIAAGEVAERFVHNLAELTGTPASRGVAAGSGTEALMVALTAVGVEPGQRVVVPTYACRALSDAALAAGATPVLADSGPGYELSPRDAAEKPGGDVAAVVVVHPFGHVLDLAPYRELGCPVIEDCAQAIPRGGRSAGADASIFSFHATKLLATGEGGAVLAHESSVAERLDEIAGGYERSGSFSGRLFVPMSDLAASLGLSQLERFDEMCERRVALARAYDTLLSGEFEVESWNGDVPFRYLVRMDAPFDRVREEMETRGVAVRRPVDPLLHSDMGLDPAGFPVAEELFAQTVSLPLYPALEDSEARRVAEALLEVAAVLAAE